MMELSLKSLQQSTVMDKYGWKCVDKFVIFARRQGDVDKLKINLLLSTAYTQKTAVLLCLFFQSFKKKVDRLSSYAQCLLLILSNKTKSYRNI